MSRPPIPAEGRKPAWRLACLGQSLGSTRGNRRSRAVCVAVTLTLERGERRSRERRGLHHEISLGVVLAWRGQSLTRSGELLDLLLKLLERFLHITFDQGVLLIHAVGNANDSVVNPP
jgi:hypothetical protein